MYNKLQMSFFQQFYGKVNPQLHLRMNDVVFLMVTSFFIGRWFEYRRYYQSSKKFSNEDEDIYQSQLNRSTFQMLSISSLPEVQVKNKQFVQIQLSPKQQKQEEQQQSQTQFSNKQNQILLEKIKLEGKKIQERGMFEMFLERKSNNLNFVRKIQRHEIISDYILKQNVANKSNRQLIPVNNESILPNEHSILELSYIQKYPKNPVEAVKPKLQKRIINLKQPLTIFSRPLFQNGRFRRLFRNHQKIGQGAFGTVLQATNVIERKKYAVKKVAMKISKTVLQNQFQKIIGQIHVLSKVTHPNIVQYHTCWLQYASLEEDEQYTNYINTHQINNDNSRRPTHLPKQEIEIKSSRKVSGYISGESMEYISSDGEDQKYFEQKTSGLQFIQQQQPIQVKSRYVQKQIARNSQIGVRNYYMGLTPVIYIQMELCQDNLMTYLRKRTSIDRRYVFSIMQGLFKGIQFLHNQGIIHRDLKPENIFLANDRKIVKIGDFGLSLHLGKQTRITSQKVGTPTYIAPQLYTKDIKQLDPYLLDVYSLGVIYYELLSILGTAHERAEKLLKLKQGRVLGLNQFKLQKNIIKSMVHLTNRHRIEQVLASDHYVELSKLLGEQ